MSPPLSHRINVSTESEELPKLDPLACDINYFDTFLEHKPLPVLSEYSPLYSLSHSPVFTKHSPLYSFSTLDVIIEYSSCPHCVLFCPQ